MADLKFTVEENPTPEDIRTVINKLVEYNSDRLIEKDVYQPLAVLIRDKENEIFGGLVGKTQWGWLFISYLWVAETLRGQGYGKQLILKAEEVAKQRGCNYAYLDTFSFQSLGFYEHLSYQKFGILENFPPGHKRYFLKKEI
ncbi:MULTISPECIES: GNAT family N-acetyltransferase [unclassified Tolypothrix]|uniref:GNAT family N-acetyltransferase n=1 Tax=unclassified Tolypothrix TaxID=2649714 RepID=UPI0005EAC66B|nr:MULTISPECIES: GNAT family N-acetyltransferase [unclassified Tolypothrix]BAY94003.1 putative N-acetylmannosamine-6-phosphate epimerase superfamily protein [Microchaete diplosiphon NIES-3275]EKF03479.1 acetyltransferase, GNAT family [Tolypothrix sp. PCC 7601]MBE9083868.1 GNAT family N-acetyltransferase [Tolypothrix sp. LEGE 11397]UYD27775.1 GNAT family N-acetyltransferase [Tolypothrix sp. PCC 7712]UYD36362.1 GNAT family N-acetyltransferase [Tolypothrix sp. PCC 7601]